MWISSDRLPTPRLVIVLVLVFLLAQAPLSYVTFQYSFVGGMLLNQGVLMFLVPAGITAVLHLDRTQLFPYAFPPRRAWWPLLGITVLAIVVSDLGLSITDAVLPIPSKIEDGIKQLLTVHGRPDFAEKFILLCVMPAIVEEFFFRGFCQMSLEKRVGTQASILLTAIFFALAHSNLWYFHLYFALGYFLGWLASLTRSLWPSSLAHLLNNTWTFVSHVAGWAWLPKGLMPQIGLVLALSILLLACIRRWERDLLPSAPIATPRR